MIIDCHGHYTTAPGPHQKFRDLQLARLGNPGLPRPRPLPIGDDVIHSVQESDPRPRASG